MPWEAEAWEAGKERRSGRGGPAPGLGQVTVGVAELLQLSDTAATFDQRIRHMVRQTLLQRGELGEPAMAPAVTEWELDREESTPRLTFCQKARLAASAEDDVQARLIEQLKLPIRGDERTKVVQRVRALVALFEGLDPAQKAKLRGRLNRPDDALARFFDCQLSPDFRHRLRTLLEAPPSPATVPPATVPPATVPRARDLRSAGHGSKALSKGVLMWGMLYERLPDGSDDVHVQLTFTPYKSYRGRAVTFLQTVLRTRTSNPDPTKRASIDVLEIGKESSDVDQFIPFYNAGWDDTKWIWVSEEGDVPKGTGHLNQPSSAADPNVYLYDAPRVGNEQAKMFESVVVVPETTETLGAIRWGVKGTPNGMRLLVPDVGKGDVSDAPTAGFLVAVGRFYAQPAAVGPDPYRDEHYDAIVDAFRTNDGMAAAVGRGIVFTPLQKASTLTADQEQKIDPIVSRLKLDPTLVVVLGGFADATEQDPRGTSKARVSAVGRYLVRQGVPKANIFVRYFGAAWARSHPARMSTAIDACSCECARRNSPMAATGSL